MIARFPGRAFCSALTLLMLLSSSALGHPMPDSVVLLDVGDDAVSAELLIPLADLELAMGLVPALAADGFVSQRREELTRYLLSHVRPASPNGAAWTVRVDDLRVEESPAEEDVYRELIARLTLTPRAGASPRVFTLHYDVVLHQVVTHAALVAVRRDWERGVLDEQVVDVGVIRWNIVDGVLPPLEVNLPGGNLWTGFLAMLRLGMSHIAEGVDHLLFLLTLLLPAPLVAAAGRWQGTASTRETLRNILKIVTAFTVGHSLTLFLGVVACVPLPTQPIEAAIALSVLVSAVHAIRPLFPKREMLVAGGFGLIHGMAFSFTLAELHLSAGQTALSLLGFNLGIELVQLLIIAVTIPVLIALARTRAYTPLRITGASAAAIAALFWLVERLS